LSGRDGLLDGSVSSDFFAVCGAVATENKWDGTEAIPPKQMVRNDYWSFDQDLEGVRSLGAVLDDGSFVRPGDDRCPTLRVALDPRLQGTAALLVIIAS